MPIPRIVSRITAVTVYASGAVVTREAVLPAAAAERLAISGLPLCLDDGSLRVRVEGVAASVVDTSIALDVPVADAALAPPEDAELRAARLAEAEAQAVLESVEARIGVLDAVQLRPRPEAQRGSPPAPIPLQARAALLDTFNSEAERLAAERAAAAEAVRLARGGRETLEARVAAASSARQARPEELRKSAVATVRWHGPATSGGRLVIEYRVPGARWLPCYVVRFIPGQDRAEIQLRAALRQRSGEDWDGVRLTVSSADHLAWCPLPVLPSRRIGRRQPTPVSGWRAPPSGAEALYADYDQATAAVAEEPIDSFGRGSVEAMVGSSAKDEGSEEEERERPRKERSRGGDLNKKMAKASVPRPIPCPSPMAGAAPVMSAPPPAPMRHASRMQDAMAEVSEPAAMYDMSAPGSPPSEPAPPRDDDPSAWLDYGVLRLTGPDDSRRGRLAPASGRDGYFTLLAEARIHIAVNVLGILHAADTQAAGTASDPPGSGWRGHDAAFACAWSADLPAQVPADGAWHVVPIHSAAVAVEQAFVCVPRESRDVFRTAGFANPFPTPLPAGPADCYLGDRFLLTAPLAAVDTGGSLRLGLGVEQGIRVSRNAAFAERNTGVFGGTTRAEHSVTISVANKLPRPVRIELRERLPVADADGCSVELQRVEPPWQEWHPPDGDLPGGHRWQIDLAAGAERGLAFAYAITFPAKQELAGGNRREA
jgi:hypothetical protein